MFHRPPVCFIGLIPSCTVCTGDAQRRLCTRQQARPFQAGQGGSDDLAGFGFMVVLHQFAAGTTRHARQNGVLHVEQLDVRLTFNQGAARGDKSNAALLCGLPSMGMTIRMMTSWLR